MQTITVTIRDQYGAQVIHPVCNTSKTFAAIAGTKTLTRQVLDQIKALGYAVEVQQPIVKL